MNKFDRLGDWRKFSAMMEKYIEGPQAKYGSGGMKFNDFCHYTGLRIFLWNMLKYPLRLWNGFGKEHDFEKTAHYTQMAWTLKERQKRKAPFFKEDVEGDYVVPDIEDSKKSLTDIFDIKEFSTDISTWDVSKVDLSLMQEVPPFRKLDHYYETPEGEEEEKYE